MYDGLQYSGAARGWDLGRHWRSARRQHGACDRAPGRRLGRVRLWCAPVAPACCRDRSRARATIASSFYRSSSPSKPHSLKPRRSREHFPQLLVHDDQALRGHHAVSRLRRKAGQLDSYWIRVKPSGPLQAQRDSALNSAWVSSASIVGGWAQAQLLERIPLSSFGKGELLP